MISTKTIRATATRSKGQFASLPSLVYVGDVAVEATVAGSTLLYRLLQDYPCERLLIAEGNLWVSRPEKRLPRVKYESFKVGVERLLRTRLHSLYSGALHLTAPSRVRGLRRIFEEFQPEAILTVAHGYSWMTATRLAKEFGLPLHLIIHDDWISIQKGVLPDRVYQAVETKFGDTYRQATSRMCVSPYMVDDFTMKYSVQGTVLYPSRPANVPCYESAPPIGRTNGKITFAFAGTVNTRGYANSLATLANVLDAAGGALIVYSDLTAADVKSCGLTGDHVTVKPILPLEDLLVSLRANVDVLFAPMSFEADDARNMRVGFPSKLADYSITGLPILIWGPPYCSAIRWARENRGVAEVVDEPEPDVLARAVTTLMADPHHRQTLGEAALIKGREYFSHETAVERFYKCL